MRAPILRLTISVVLLATSVSLSGLPYSRMSGSIASMGGGASADTRTWIAPPLYAPPSFEAYRARRDPALEAILAYGRDR